MKAFFILAIAFYMGALKADQKPAPETFKINITVMGQNCGAKMCKDNFPGEGATFDIPLTECDDDPTYGKSCWGTKTITKDFTDADGVQLTYSVTPAHYYNTSDDPEFKKLSFNYEVYLDICELPSKIGDSNCSRTSITLKDPSVPLYKQEFTTALRKDGSYSQGYLWVSQSSCFYQDCSDQKKP